MKKLLLVILSFVYLNTRVNNKMSTTKKNTQSALNLNNGNRRNNLKKEIEMLKKHLEKERENTNNNNTEVRESLENAIYSLEQDLKKFKN